jgi:hypothetical protein
MNHNKIPHQNNLVEECLEIFIDIFYEPSTKCFYS